MGTEAGYLLELSIDSGVLDPQGGNWGWFNQVDEWGDNWFDFPEFRWHLTADSAARGAVWVSQADLSAYGIATPDQLAALRLMEATGNYLRPAWRVTCRWEAPAPPFPLPSLVPSPEAFPSATPEELADMEAVGYEIWEARQANTARWFNWIREQEPVSGARKPERSGE